MEHRWNGAVKDEIWQPTKKKLGEQKLGDLDLLKAQPVDIVFAELASASRGSGRNQPLPVEHPPRAACTSPRLPSAGAPAADNDGASADSERLVSEAIYWVGHSAPMPL